MTDLDKLLDKHFKRPPSLMTKHPANDWEIIEEAN